MHEGQFDSPVMREIELTPLRVVEISLGELEITRLGKVSLVVSKVEVVQRIAAIAKGKLPAEIEQQVFTRRDGGESLSRWRLRVAGEERSSAAPGGAGCK